MTAAEARNKSTWNNIKGVIRRAITENIEDGLYQVTIEEKYMDIETQYDLQNLGYGIFFNKHDNTYIIKW